LPSVTFPNLKHQLTGLVCLLVALTPRDSFSPTHECPC
jgi:hypothetical protein